MKKIVLLVGILFLFTACGEQPPLKKVIDKRVSITKGMSKSQVKSILGVEPDEISQVGDTTLWIYKGVLGEDEEKTFNDFIIKFKDNKVVYTGFFRCKLPKEE